MKIRSRTLNIFLAAIATIILRLLFLTVRVDHRKVVVDATPYARPKGTTRYTFCMWHDGIVLAVFSLKTWCLSGLISQHRDGGYLADSAKIAGIRPVRGSASRGGAEAIGTLLSIPEYHLAMTPDGPRGPRRILKEGIIFIASRSRRPIVPTAIAASPAWSIQGSWTDLLIPRPFARVLLISGKPIEIPEKLTRDRFAEYTAILQAEMNRLDALAARLIAGDETAGDEIAARALFPHERELRASAAAEPEYFKAKGRIADLQCGPEADSSCSYAR